jgi:MerR family copper efflux transcriptional regulator
LGWYDGAVYRIGELAALAMVSKRTIDYYTSLGLLKAERSKSNYRIYSDESLDTLKFIEDCKSLHYPLDEIKRKLEMKKAVDLHELEVEEHVKAVNQQIIQLRSDLFDLLPIMEHLSEPQKEKFINNLSLLNAALSNSLLKI